MHRLGQQVLAVSGTGAFSTEKSNWSWPQPISISFLKSWREYFEWMTCFPFLASHRHAAYSEDFFDCRGETFISKEHCPRKNFSDCFACRIYIGLKMKILISCHVKIDAAREIKIMFSAAQDYPPFIFGLKSGLPDLKVGDAHRGNCHWWYLSLKCISFPSKVSIPHAVYSGVTLNFLG